MSADTDWTVASNPLELEWQEAVSCFMRVLGMERRFSSGTLHALNLWAISAAHKWLLSTVSKIRKRKQEASTQRAPLNNERILILRPSIAMQPGRFELELRSAKITGVYQTHPAENYFNLKELYRDFQEANLKEKKKNLTKILISCQRIPQKNPNFSPSIHGSIYYSI